MKLDRNITTPRRGKYAVIKLRDATIRTEYPQGGALLIDQECVDFGDTPETDFFVIRLKDKYAAAALAAYAGAAMRDDPEYALDVLNLAKAAAESPCQKQPD
jgi:hypothetical protein